MSETTVTKNCLHCNEEFTTRKTEIKRGNGKFCNLSCSSSYHAQKRSEQKKPNVECAYCGKEFYKNATKRKASKSGLHFCCREHKDKAQRIEFGLEEIHPDHYNGGSSDYRKIAFRNQDSGCNRCGFQEHLEVLVVHHKDRDRLNNDPDNLEILCPTCHEIEHFLARDGRWTSNKKPKSTTCEDCETSISPYSTRCSSCAAVNQSGSNINWPEPALLEDLIWEKPMSHLAEEWDVSIRSIRNKCQEYGIERPPKGHWN